MRKKIIISFLILSVTLLCLTACIQFRESTRLLLEQFPEAHIDTAKYGGRTLRYMTLHRKRFFPHGFFPAWISQQHECLQHLLWRY
jgi:hypothetical protein